MGNVLTDDEIYRRVVRIVAAAQRASTSYIQQQLCLDYKRAVQFLDRMESDGLLGAPDHVGRREVLVDVEGHRRIAG